MKEKRKVRLAMKKRTSRIIRAVLFVVALAVFCFSAYKLCSIFFEYKRGEQEYEEIVKEVTAEEKVDEEQPAEGEEESDPTIFRVDFQKLKKMNEETVAWIRFENPSQINYPILQADNNDKYLKTTFEHKRNSAGAIFMDAQNREDFSDRNTLIYGHNMKNGTMFGKLREYKKYDFYKENPYFYIYTPNGMEYKYQVFAVSVVQDDAENYREHFANDQEFLAYLERITAKSIYQTGVEVVAESKVITLSTCTNVTESQRLVVHGVKVEEKVMGE